MKIAVIGTGISGLGAAHFLARKHEVVLFEKDGRAGGHTNTINVPTAQGELAIDTGFIVCNPFNYPNFYRFLDELGVARQDTDMSLGVSVDNGRIEWAGDQNPFKIFAQPSLIASPTHIRMLLSVMRFNKQVRQLLAEDRLPGITVGEFLEQNRYPMALRVRYVAAMAGPIWSTSTRGVMDFPFRTFAQFFDSHGLLNVYERPQWQTIVGGSRTYVQRILAGFNGEVRFNSPVQALRRKTDGAHVRTAQGGDERFDAVVCATHSDQALALLADASPVERAVLVKVPFSTNTAYLHTDETQMPRRRAVWSSWNAILAKDGLTDDPIGVRYWMNKLHNFDSPINYIVSLNPPEPPRASSILYQARYEHPVYNQGTVTAQQQLPSIQGANRIWWAGAWTRYGFHEDGFKSALGIAKAFGCAPAWATGIEPQRTQPATLDEALEVE
jgi:predicted NAD/FAD-binding protein